MTWSYFNAILKFHKNLQNEPELIKALLISILGDNGIRNSQESLKSRAFYAFAKFVSDHSNKTKPFIKSILESVDPFLIVSLDVNMLSEENQRYLYETIGTLVSVQENDHKLLGIERVTSGLIKQVEQILNNSLYKSDTVDHCPYANLLAQIIALLGTFMKRNFFCIDSKGSLFFLL